MCLRFKSCIHCTLELILYLLKKVKITAPYTLHPTALLCTCSSSFDTDYKASTGKVVCMYRNINNLFRKRYIFFQALGGIQFMRAEKSMLNERSIISTEHIYYEAQAAPSLPYWIHQGCARQSRRVKSVCFLCPPHPHPTYSTVMYLRL